MASLSWKNLNVEHNGLRLIHNVNGNVSPGQILAVMGPSGAGKTTLFNVLSKRSNAGFVVAQGTELLLDGQPYSRDDLRQCSGFVWQEPLFFSRLTCREHLMMCARLRRSETSEERRARVEHLLHELDLDRCADVMIGGEEDNKKGISGGERKRLSIAQELLHDPRLLFLDEPTSGLDSTSAYRVMSLLRKVANEGTTVVCTIHQPRPAIAKAIDSFLVLSSGHQIFFGSGQDMLEHFAQLGYICPAGENPLDYILDLINTEKEEEHPSKGSLEPLPSAVAQGQTRQELAAQLAETYRNSKMGQFQPNIQAEKLIPDDNHRTFQPSSWFARFAVVAQRELLQKIRHPQVGLTQLGTATFTGLVLGSFYFKVPVTEYVLMSNALAFALIMTVFFSFHLVIFFPKDRHMFIREFTQGTVGSSEYFFGLVCSDIPITFLSTLVYCCIFYWMVGLRSDAAAFFTFLGVCLLVAFAGSSLLLAIGAFCPDVSTANTIVSLVTVFVLFLNGYFASQPIWIWIETINYMRFATFALFRNQWQNLPIPCTGQGSTTNCSVFSNGNQVLMALKVPTNVDIGIWCLYIAIAMLVFLIIGLGAVSILYNGRLTQWKEAWKRKNE